MKIAAAIMVRNMSAVISACVSSLQWVDEIYLYDDNSTDGTVDVAKQYSHRPIHIESSNSSIPAFTRGELDVRNYIINRAFRLTNADLLLIVDGDEMIDCSLEEKVKNLHHSSFDSISLGMWHLYTPTHYLHFWEQTIHKMMLLDPHTRIIKKGRYFEELFEDGTHPVIKVTNKTFYLNGPYHFHLKYYYKSPYPNRCLDFLPEEITINSVRPYLRELPFKLPRLIAESIKTIDWNSLKYEHTYDNEKIHS